MLENLVDEDIGVELAEANESAGVECVVEVGLAGEIALEEALAERGASGGFEETLCLHRSAFVQRLHGAAL